MYVGTYRGQGTTFRSPFCSPLPSSGFWGLNSGHQARQQAPLPTEPSFWPCSFILAISSLSMVLSWVHPGEEVKERPKPRVWAPEARERRGWESRQQLLEAQLGYIWLWALCSAMVTLQEAFHPCLPVTSPGHGWGCTSSIYHLLLASYAGHAVSQNLGFVAYKLELSMLTAGVVVVVVV